MRRILFKLFFASVFLICSSSGPPNCNLYKDDPNCYEACLEAERAVKHGQGSKPSQMHFNKSIELCPSFDYSYFEKAVPFAKRGMMREWKTMIDKAVQLNPETYLSNRGYYHFFFMSNYEKAIADIDSLDKIVNYDLGYPGSGTYHLNIVKALCYKGLGRSKKAIEIITDYMETEAYYTGAYDFIHLGVLYLEEDKPLIALDNFKKQIEFNDVSEAHYYSALAYSVLNDSTNYKKSLLKALDYYKQRKTMNNPYRQLPDEIFKSDIEEKLQSGFGLFNNKRKIESLNPKR